VQPLPAGPWVDVGSGLFFIIAGLALVVAGIQQLVA